jgi:hypothetical protein
VRQISALSSRFGRLIASALAEASDQSGNPPRDSRTELDSHADTWVCGRNSLITAMTDEYVDLSPFAATLGTMSRKPVCSHALAWDNVHDGTTIILMIHQSISVPEMENNLACPMQSRMNDVTIHECPKFLDRSVTDKSHTIIIPTEEGNVTIPLGLYGVTSFFTTRKPTEWEMSHCERVSLTYEDPKWDPHSPVYARQEESMTGPDGVLRAPK